MVITATIPRPERNAQEHDQTAVSLGFLGCSSLYRLSIMGVFSRYYHLINQNFTGWRDTGLPGITKISGKEGSGTVKGAKGGLTVTSKVKREVVAVPNHVLKVQKRE